ncbi:hypothetical protein Q8A67_002549 [Cirrhinus molitorella]|uniref:Uncharacterized protein n=1 Tax=Cirrhinus molitorella TaxID=172907 RepID=A0AA88QHX7_9TELE|nr:hypothetical protein Q8A67_002549 [Cirrhinus molitorella]
MWQSSSWPSGEFIANRLKITEAHLYFREDDIFRGLWWSSGLVGPLSRQLSVHPKPLSVGWRPCGQVEKNKRRWQLRDHGSTCQRKKNRAPDRVRQKSIFCCSNYPRTILKESTKLVIAVEAIFDQGSLRLASASAERFDCSGAEFISSSQLQQGMRDRMADVIRSRVTGC